MSGNVMKVPVSIFVFFSLFHSIMLEPACAQETGRMYTIAVLNLDPKGVSQVEAEVLSDKLRSQIILTVSSDEYREAEEKDQYTVVEQNQIDRIFDQFGIQNTGCVSDSCAIEFGHILQVDRIVVGTVGLIGQTYSISTRIVDVETARTLSTSDRQSRGSIDDLMNKVIAQASNDILWGRPEKSRMKWYAFAAGITTGVIVYYSIPKEPGEKLPFPPGRP